MFLTSPKYRVVGLLATAAIAIGACGSATVTPTPTAAPTPTPVATPVPTATPTPIPLPTQRVVASLLPEQVVAAGQLTICSDTQNPPQEFLDSQGFPTGSDIALAHEMANRLGLKLAVVSTASSSIVAALGIGTCDIAISAQDITTATLKKVDMLPYFQAGQVFVVAKGNPSGIKTVYDLCGKAVGVRRKTAESDHLLGGGSYNPATGLSAMCLAADKKQITVKSYASDSAAIIALEAGKLAACFTESPVAGYAVVQAPDQLELVPDLVLNEVIEGISFAKGHDELFYAVQAALQSMMDDGTYLQILKTYGVQADAVASTYS